MARPREGYYPETITLGRAFRWHDKPLVIQHDRNVPLRPLPSNKAKAPPIPKSRVCECQVQPRTESDWESQVMDFDSYSAHFALGPEAQAEVGRRVREDTARNAAEQAQIEGKSVAKEIERKEQERIERELKAETAA